MGDAGPAKQIPSEECHDNVINQDIGFMKGSCTRGSDQSKAGHRGWRNGPFRH